MISFYIEGMFEWKLFIFCEVFRSHCLSFVFFSFGHCIICLSSIYGFWLPLWYLQTFLIDIQSRGRDRMVVGFTTTYAISAYHHYRILFRRGAHDTKLCDQICQWLVEGRWFYSEYSVSSTSNTDRHDITEILFKVVLNTILPFLLRKHTQ